MAFCFNFSNPSGDSAENPTNCVRFEPSDKNDCTFSNPCEYVFCSHVDLKEAYSKLKRIKFASFEIKYITQKSVASQIENLDVFSNKESDLVPGKYEGGMKVWECSIDLSQYLAGNNLLQEGAEVLELGCGIGLPGLVAYLSGGFVTFQDFNSEVLKLVTVPNVWLNTQEDKHHEIPNKCHFLCGDWHDIKEIFYSDKKEKKLFDIILTSETIYDKSNQRKLLNLMKLALKPDGVIYLASKVHYFGVGGGIADFEKLLKEDNTFEFSTVFRTTEGVERRILKLTHKNE